MLGSQELGELPSSENLPAQSLAPGDQRPFPPMSNESIELEGELQDRSIVEIIGGIYTHKLTGVLELAHDDHRRRFYFLSGELYLPGSHGLAQTLASYLDRERDLGEPDAAGDDERARDRAGARAELERVVGRIVDVMAEWRTGRFTFDQSVEEVPEDVVGPLPTAYLVMEGAVRHREPHELMQRLGGEDRLLVASLESDLLNRLHGLDPEQMFLLSRAEQPIAVGELLRQVSIDRQATLRKLCRLHAIGLLQDLEPAAPVDRSQERLVDSLVRRFSGRLEQRLQDDPIALDAGEHRARIAELLRDVGSLSHYELLGVGLHSTQEEVYAAYDALGRLVHPSHTSRLGLTGREAALRTLFERATVAYLILADPERRAAYNVNAGIDAVRTPSPDSRSEEQRRLAREAFEKAEKRFVAEDFHTAMELVKQAVRLDSRPEYYALQGRIEARNPHWLYRAAESLRHALRLDPSNADYRVALGDVLEARGDRKGAGVHYRVALKERPGHEGAKAGLERVGAAAPEPAAESPRLGERATIERGGEARRKGLLGRLKSLLGD